jgi:hypothetical protein
MTTVSVMVCRSPKSQKILYAWFTQLRHFTLRPSSPSQSCMPALASGHWASSLQQRTVYCHAHLRGAVLRTITSWSFLSRQRHIVKTPSQTRHSEPSSWRHKYWSAYTYGMYEYPGCGRVFMAPRLYVHMLTVVHSYQDHCSIAFRILGGLA